MKKEAENLIQRESGEEDPATQVKNVIITHPDYFKQRQKNLLKRACKEAGFESKRITLLSRAHAAIHTFNLSLPLPLKVLTIHIGA